MIACMVGRLYIPKKETAFGIWVFSGAGARDSLYGMGSALACEVA